MLTAALRDLSSVTLAAAQADPRLCLDLPSKARGSFIDLGICSTDLLSACRHNALECILVVVNEAVFGIDKGSKFVTFRRSSIFI